MAESISRDGDTGRAVVTATGTLVDDILAALQEGGGFESVLRRHPELTPDAVVAALRFARAAVARETRYSPDSRHGVSELREQPARPYGARPATLERYEAVERFDRFESLGEDAADREFFGEGLVTPADDADGSLAEALRSARGNSARLRYELDLAESIEAGLEDAVAGRVMPHEEVMAKLRGRFPG